MRREAESVESSNSRSSTSCREAKVVCAPAIAKNLKKLCKIKVFVFLCIFFLKVCIFFLTKIKSMSPNHFYTCLARDNLLYRQYSFNSAQLMFHGEHGACSTMNMAPWESPIAS
jgi:hypothetical protein